MLYNVLSGIHREFVVIEQSKGKNSWSIVEIARKEMTVESLLY